MDMDGKYGKILKTRRELCRQFQAHLKGSTQTIALSISNMGGVWPCTCVQLLSVCGAVSQCGAGDQPPPHHGAGPDHQLQQRGPAPAHQRAAGQVAGAQQAEDGQHQVGAASSSQTQEEVHLLVTLLSSPLPSIMDRSRSRDYLCGIAGC